MKLIKKDVARKIKNKTVKNPTFAADYVEYCKRVNGEKAFKSESAQIVAEKISAERISAYLDKISGVEPVPCNKSCENWMSYLEHRERACCLSDVYSVRKGEPCYNYKQQDDTDEIMKSFKDGLHTVGGPSYL